MHHSTHNLNQIHGRSHIKAMTFNVYYKTQHWKTNTSNIINCINKETPDLLGLQEARHLISNTKHANQIGLPLYNQNQCSATYGFSTSIIYWNPTKFSKTGTACVSVDAVINKSDGRPCIGVKLRHIDTRKIYNVISCHFGHHATMNHFKYYITTILTRLKYSSSDHVIVLGDFNELIQHNTTGLRVTLNNTLTLALSNNQPFNTCCGKLKQNGDDFSTKPTRQFDLIFASSTLIFLNSTVTPVHTASDHLPVMANLMDYQDAKQGKPWMVLNKVHRYQYSIYLVPVGLKVQPVQAYWKQWGGTVPHCTLVSFNHYNGISLTVLLNYITRNNNKKHWILGNRPVKIKHTATLCMLHFTSSSLTKLTRMLGKQGLLIKTNYHFTLGKNTDLDSTKEQTISRALKQATAWKLVLVEKRSSDFYRWKESGVFYDQS